VSVTGYATAVRLAFDEDDRFAPGQQVRGPGQLAGGLEALLTSGQPGELVLARTQRRRTQQIQLVVSDRVQQGRRVGGDDELRRVLTGQIPQIFKDLALQDRMQMLIDFVDQHGERHRWCPVRPRVEPGAGFEERQEERDGGLLARRQNFDVERLTGTANGLEQALTRFDSASSTTP
jgi:hypothetical protein